MKELENKRERCAGGNLIVCLANISIFRLPGMEIKVNTKGMEVGESVVNWCD